MLYQAFIKRKIITGPYCIIKRDYTINEIRNKFLTYYKNQGYKQESNLSLLTSSEDKSLLFNNAGMVPFKSNFLNPDLAFDKLVTTCQPCLRVGGKQNDLEQVGYTDRHLTFFEMLGNFSFGEKKEVDAMKEAFFFLTKELNIPLDKLKFTVLNTDTQTYKLWESIGIPKSQLEYLTDKDNFWSMGKPISSNQRLPCGPCTEIYYDINPSLEWKNEERWLEIWNLVFMRYSMDFNGQLNELKRTCIDTGMGLERLGSVLQGKTNNFDIDSFYNLSVQIDSCIQPELIVNLTSLQIQSFKRIIMDHIRSISLLISEGILPSNIGRGYVLRRLLRRCLRIFKQLKIQGSLNQFVDSIDLPINYYNKFYERKEHIMKVIKDEEENFNKLLEIGVDKLDKYFKMNENNVNKVINKELIFQLYDSYGFPFDLTEAIAIENGYQLDQLGFQQLLKLQKEKSKAQNNNNFNYQFTKEFNFKQIDIDSNFKQTFLGYKYNPNNVYKTEIKYVQDNWLILQPNIFYGYGGGQENDLGKIKLLNETKEFNIINTKKIENDIIMIQIDNNNNNNNKQEILKQGDIVISELNWTYRFGLMIHHSATHLLNYVLKQVLDKNIIQQGSKVSFNKLRFDFNYNSNITEDQICQIEDSINHILLTQTLIKKETIPYEEAIKLGAIATFSEKYPKLVNTIKLYNSFELCSGTHVEKLSDIYPFKISNISTISSGIKRIEAHCGLECIKQLLNKENQVNKFKKLIKVKDFNQVVDKLDKLETENKKLKKENEKLRLEKMKASNDNNIINNNISNKENNTNEIEKQIIEININNEVIQLACFKTNLNLEQKEMIQIIKTLAIDKSIALLIDNQKLLMYKKDMGLKLNVGQYLKDLLKDVGKGGGAHDLAFGKLKENNRVDLSLKEIIEKLFNNK